MSATWLANLSHERPHADRVAAMSSALAIHVLVFGLLLLPLTRALDLPERVRPADKPLDVTFIERQETLPVPPIPTPPIIRPRTEPRPTPVEVPVDQTTIVVDATNPVPIDTRPTEPTAPVDPGPGPVVVPVGSLAYEYAPPPPYPAAAQRKRWQGKVVLRVLVGTDGSPLRVEIERSSGRAVLDVAARNKVADEWRFRPAIRDGVPVQAIGLVPVSFSLYER